MILYRNLSAKYKLDSRLMNGQRLETDTLVSVDYYLRSSGVDVLKKSLSDGGLTIENADDGEGFIYVNISAGELDFIGSLQQRLIVSGCDGQDYGAIVRPEIIYVKE